MRSRGYRFEFGLLVLLGCAIAAWHGDDRTPTHEVVELVSVVYKPARIVPSEPAPSAGEAPGERASHAAAPAQQASAVRVAAPKPPAQVRVPPAVQHAKAEPRQRSGGACRPPGCNAKARSTTAAPTYAKARQARDAQAPLPAVLVPIRTFGLYLQDRLGLQQQGKPPRKRQR